MESHQIPGDLDLACFFLLTAFQDGGHLVGGKGFGNIEMDVIAIEMGEENAGQIGPTEMKIRQTVRQSPGRNPRIKQVAVDAAVGPVKFKQARVARRAAGQSTEGDHSPGAYPATPWPTTGR